ncbi:MAG: glycosyl transferase family 1 [Actinomycetaceae bacterium]|nr:glycosyl transferase family 1 [Actinomycetaceae bacterium]
MPTVNSGDATAKQPSMVFHAPYPMEPNPTAASRLRPLRMREAFASIGYRVIDVSGTTPQRRKALKELRAMLRRGERPEFLYSENSTQPNLLATSVKDGVAPFLDYAIMKEARRAGVPVGIFYRDVYWKFSFGAPSLRKRILPWLQAADLRGYLRNGAHFFLPSAPMGKYLELPAGVSTSVLPPAGDKGMTLPLPAGPLRLFYVGGLGGHYKFETLLHAVRDLDGLEMDLVTRKQQWEQVVSQDPSLADPSISVHHLTSNELDPLYERCHVGILAVDPSEYWRFAVPVKLFEYISRGRPILVTKGTEAARIVEDLGVGWSVENTYESIMETLVYLSEHPEEVQAKAEHTVEVAPTQTWEARANTVAKTLKGRF